MKKLLLTSDGLSSRKIMKEAKKLLTKPAKETRALIIYTLRKKSYIKYVRKVKKHLLKLGIKRKSIFYANISHNITVPKQDFDIIYSCGGNTFFILNRMRKTGFDKFIKKFIKKGGFYIGVSAGSILVSKNIELAGWDRGWDVNDVGLKNLKGLNLAPAVVCPHFTAKEKKRADSFEKAHYPIVRLRDRQALLILGNKVKKI